MKRGGSFMSAALRAELEQDPEYTRCALKDISDILGQCGGRVTREHALIYAGKKIQERWAIIPLCARHHAVDQYQDAGTMVKQRNIWVALNRATDSELAAISKVTDYRWERERLNKEYGPYVPPPVPTGMKIAPAPFKKARTVSEKVDEVEREARQFARANGVGIEQARELLLTLI